MPCNYLIGPIMPESLDWYKNKQLSRPQELRKGDRNV